MIPAPYRIIALIALICALVGGHFLSRHFAYEDGKKAGAEEVTKEWKEEQAKQAQDLLEHNAAVREEEKRRTIAQEQIDRDNQTRIAKAQSDAASASSALERLRIALKTPGTTPSKRLPGDPVPTFVCTADAEVRELLRSCAGRYVSMAGEADKAYSAGLACEKWADSLQVRP